MPVLEYPRVHGALRTVTWSQLFKARRVAAHGTAMRRTDRGDMHYMMIAAFVLSYERVWHCSFRFLKIA